MTQLHQQNPSTFLPKRSPFFEIIPSHLQIGLAPRKACLAETLDEWTCPYNLRSREAFYHIWKSHSASYPCFEISYVRTTIEPGRFKCRLTRFESIAVSSRVAEQGKLRWGSRCRCCWVLASKLGCFGESWNMFYPPSKGKLDAPCVQPPPIFCSKKLERGSNETLFWFSYVKEHDFCFPFGQAFSSCCWRI